MGYTTTFKGSLSFSRELTLKEYKELEKLADYNSHQEGYREFGSGFPDSYNQWEPNEDGTAFGWNGGEKFYNYIEWLDWLAMEYFEPRGIKLNGKIEWSGEEMGDTGTISVLDNFVKTEENSIDAADLASYVRTFAAKYEVDCRESIWQGNFGEDDLKTFMEKCIELADAWSKTDE